MNTSDALQLISIIIAINALVTGFFVWIIDKDRRLLKKNVQGLKTHVKFTESVIETIIEWLIAQEKMQRVEQGGLYKQMKNEERRRIR